MKKQQISSNNQVLNSKSHRRKINKRGLRASGLSLLPLALRPGLLMMGGMAIVGAIVGSSLISSNLASAASISLSIPNTLSLNIDSASPSGTFSKSDKAEISTKTDSKNGYTLSIKSKDSVDSNCLKNGDKKLESISSEMNESEYESSGQMNSWAYQPTKFSSLVNSNFLPAPTSSESIIDKTSTANTLNNNYGIVLAAKVNTDLPAGSYKNTYVLTATSNALTYSVHYNLNDGQDGPSPNPQTGQLDGDTFKLDGTTPTKEGFEFKGWCTEQTSDDSCSGGVFQPGSNYRIYCDDNDIELYAMWKERPVPTTMQDFNDYCSAMKNSQTLSLTDSRDSNKYSIAKLNDGKCWMTQNLKIAGKTLTSADSDVASNFILPSSSKSGFSNYDTSYVYIDSTNGGYYSWYAATAGDGKQNFSSGDTTHSICPKGWHLPTKAEYDNLISIYKAGSNGKILQNAPMNLIKGGYYRSGTLGYTAFGFYWCSTASDEYNAWDLTVEDSGIRTGSDGGMDKYHGMLVRCLSNNY